MATIPDRGGDGKTKFKSKLEMVEENVDTIQGYKKIREYTGMEPDELHEHLVSYNFMALIGMDKK